MATPNKVTIECTADGWKTTVFFTDSPPRELVWKLEKNGAVASCTTKEDIYDILECAPEEEYTPGDNSLAEAIDELSGIMAISQALMGYK